MEIKIAYINKNGQPAEALYRDIESKAGFEGKAIYGARAYCFHNDKLVIVHEEAGHWGMPGGGMDEGEDIGSGIAREVREETNMKVIDMRFLGVIEDKHPEGTKYHVWAVCTVEPFGSFESDPAGEISEIREIDPQEWPTYPGASSDAIRTRVYERALEVKAQMSSH
jgi:ADP-ribose pyrophosphatase YjhB (NUDIX family)